MKRAQHTSNRGRASRRVAGARICLLAFGVVVAAASSCNRPADSTGGRGIREFGRRGSSPGRFSFPREILVAKDGHLVVIDRTGRIQHLKPDGTHIKTWKVPDASNGTPTGAAFDRDGNLLVADTHYSRVLRYSEDGSSPTQFGRYGEGRGEFVFPTDVAVDHDGNIYVTNYGYRDRVMKFHHDGTFVDEWGSTGSGPGQFQRPMAIALLNDNGLVVADSCNHRIQRFDLNGNFLGKWGGVGKARGRLNYPYDVETDREGRVYVAEYGNNRVSIFSSTGRFLEIFGRPGNALGQLRGPWGVAIDPEGRLYVADTYNHRIQSVHRGAI